MHLCALDCSEHLRAPSSCPTWFSYSLACALFLFSLKKQREAWALKAKLCLVSGRNAGQGAWLTRDLNEGLCLQGTWASSLAPSCLMPQAASCPSSTFWLRVLGCSSDSSSKQMSCGISKQFTSLHCSPWEVGWGLNQQIGVLKTGPKGIHQPRVFHWWKECRATWQDMRWRFF